MMRNPRPNEPKTLGPIIVIASVLLLATGAAIWIDTRPAQRSFRMISSKLSRMVRHGASAVKVVSFRQTHNTLVRTDLITVSSCNLIFMFFPFSLSYFFCGF